MSEEPLTQDEAIEALDGHGVLSEVGARKVCAAFGVQLEEDLILRWTSAKEAWEKYSFIATSDAGAGVGGLELSYSVCKQLGIDPAPGHRYTGKGYQARANQQVIKAYFEGRKDAQEHDTATH